ncbi:MAG: hypothetical protein VX577_03360 [Verrucomicrobiota bacterium]|nr:hypothetical protein [Verrucomicrobiota bacterium]
MICDGQFVIQYDKLSGYHILIDLRFGAHDNPKSPDPANNKIQQSGQSISLTDV